MGPNLFVTSPLPPTGTITIGRDEEADIRVVDESASRLHARLHVDAAAQLFIEDLGTKNGTFLRESRIAPNERIPFQLGEAINIGFTIVMVQRRRPAPQTRRFRTPRSRSACRRPASRPRSRGRPSRSRVSSSRATTSRRMIRTVRRPT